MIDLESLEHSPDDIVVHDTDGRRLFVSPSSATGAVFIVERTGHHEATVAVLDRDNACGLSDALTWAARAAVSP